MTLGELLENLPFLEDGLTIYASADPDWRCDSVAVAIYELEDEHLPVEVGELKYLLEVGIAKEVLRVWSKWRSGKEPSRHERCEAVIYYANNDAYLPV